MPPSTCQQLKQGYGELKTLKAEFSLALNEPTKQSELEKAKQLKLELEKKRNELREKFWPLKEFPEQELKKQYDSQKEILERTGVLKRLSNGDFGIKGIDNKEYSFPTYQEISQRMIKHREMLIPKTEHGFNQLLIVPFGMKLEDLIEKYKQTLLDHYRQGKLLRTKKNPADPDEPITNLDQNKPVWVSDRYKQVDEKGDLVYFPKEFDTKKHQGKTKKEVLQTQGGYQILLLEDLSDIPRQRKGKETYSKRLKQTRKQLEAGLTPKKYLKTLQKDKTHRNETGMTPEDWLIYALKYLENNQVIDDWRGNGPHQVNGSLSFQLNAFFPASMTVPYTYTCWDGSNARVFLDNIVPEKSRSYYGAHFVVRVEA